MSGILRFLFFLGFCASITPGTTRERSSYLPFNVRTLCESSTHVVLARVQAVTKRARLGKDCRHSHQVKLRVLRHLYGPSESESITCTYAGPSHAFNGPDFQIGDVRIFYLRPLAQHDHHDEEEVGDALCLTANELGVVYGSQEKLQAYAEAILAWPGSREHENEKAKHAAMLAWVVDLTVEPHTRTDGAIELSPFRYRGLSTYRKWPYEADKLNATQRERIFEAWLPVTKFERHDLLLYRAFENHEDLRLDRFLFEYLSSWEGSLGNRFDYWLSEGVRRRQEPALTAFFESRWSQDPKYLHRHDVWGHIAGDPQEFEDLNTLLELLTTE